MIRSATGGSAPRAGNAARAATSSPGRAKARPAPERRRRPCATVIDIAWVSRPASRASILRRFREDLLVRLAGLVIGFLRRGALVGPDRALLPGPALVDAL